MFETVVLPCPDDGAGPSWRPALLGHLMRLDAESRRMRFLSPAGDAAIAAHVAAAQPVALVLFRPDGVLRGCAEVHPGARPGMAEVALSLEPDWQSHGHGRALTEAATRLAGKLGFSDIRLTCLRQNIRMMRIARGLSAYRLPVADWALALFRFDPAPAGA
jgi:GNAT superfamily N-acetyltransferase